MKMGEQESSKWEGETSVELKLRPEKVWAVISDFCSAQKILPHVEKCYLVEGSIEGEVGMIRCCESSGKFPGKDIQWAKEKLLMIDPSIMCLSYCVVDNNIGFDSYIATLRLFPINGGDDDGCKLVWSFVADPVQGFNYQSFCEFLAGLAHTMAKSIEEEALSQC